MKTYYLSIAAAAMVAFFVPACSEDGLSPSSDCVETVINLSGIEPYTKSVINGVETLVTEVKLAAYDQDGLLEASCYYETDSADGLELTLNANNSHTVYALVNMGDIAVPLDESSVPSLEYTIESYSKMGSTGLPMAGYATMNRGDNTCTLPVTRLVAKLTLTMASGDVTPDQISQVRLCNWNKRLLPFDSNSSKALETGDVASGEEGQYDTVEWDGAELVFYVPENMQGTLLENNTDQKSKTYSAIENTGLAAFCTYLEVDAEIDADSPTGVYGSLSYRFYLGSDTTTNFDIKRGIHYALSFSLSWDGQFYKDTWMVNNDLTDSRTLSLSTLTVTPTSAGFTTSTSSSGTLECGYETAVYASLLVGENDIGDSSWGEAYGWCVPDSCVTRLAGLGISCTVEKTTMFYDTESLMPCYVRSGSSIPSTYEDIDQSERPSIILGMSSYDYSRATVDLTVQTVDGQKFGSIRISLRPHIDPEVTLDGDDSGHYIAQQHLLSVSDLPSGVSSSVFNVVNSTDTVAAINDGVMSLTSCYINMLKKGKAYISMTYTYEVNGVKIFGSKVIKCINVKAPELRVTKDGDMVSQVTITTDGSTSTVLIAYYDEDGNQMVCSGTSLKKTESMNNTDYSYPDDPTEFYRPLFEDILSPVVTTEDYEEEKYMVRIDDSEDEDYELTGSQVGVQCTAEAEGEVECRIKSGNALEIQENHPAGYVLVNATACDDIAEQKITVYVADERS